MRAVWQRFMVCLYDFQHFKTLNSCVSFEQFRFKSIQRYFVSCYKTEQIIFHFRLLSASTSCVINVLRSLRVLNSFKIIIKAIIPEQTVSLFPKLSNRKTKLGLMHRSVHAHSAEVGLPEAFTPYHSVHWPTCHFAVCVSYCFLRLKGLPVESMFCKKNN